MTANPLPLVSIVWVTHGRPEFLRKSLRSCIEQDYPNKELVVLLNPQDTRAEAVVRETAPEARVVRTHRNLGAFPGLNIALANAFGDYVMTVDDDAWFLDSGVLAQLVHAFATEPELGAVTCNIEGEFETTHAGPDRYVPVFKAGFSLVPRAAFTEWVDWYPDIFFRSAGETFLCSALWDQGRPVKCLTSARMFHEQTLEGRSVKGWMFHNQRNQVLCSIMRDPLVVLPLVLGSKAVKSFRVCALKSRWPLLWLQIWLSVLAHVPQAVKLRSSISLATWKLLRRLQRNYVTENPFRSSQP